MEALISWRVRSIAYTPENYHIEFGGSSDDLSMRSEIINGTSNLTSTNLLYSTTLTDLSPFTRYYYRIVATNSFIVTQTEVQTFQTSEAGMHYQDYNTKQKEFFFSSLFFIAPSAPPNMFSTLNVSPRNVTLSWTLPEESERNGVITGYTVTCTDGSVSMTHTVTITTATVTSLDPSSLYMCNVTASTRAGSSPAAFLNFTTTTAGMEFSITNVYTT